MTRITLHKVLCTLKIITRSLLHRMKNVSDKIVENIKTHILCSITFSLNEIGVACGAYGGGEGCAQGSGGET